MTAVGILHPGEMGAAFGAVLRDAGHSALWLSTDRSDATQARAAEASFEDAGSLGTPVQPRVLSGPPGDASAVKCAFAAWTKSSGALLFAIRAFARAEGVEGALLEEWAVSLPELEPRSEAAQQSAAAKGWRWTGELEEIASAFEARGLPRGFHEAAAEIFRRPPGRN